MKNENGLYFLNHDLLIRTLDSNFSTSHFTILFGIRILQTYLYGQARNAQTLAYSMYWCYCCYLLLLPL